MNGWLINRKFQKTSHKKCTDNEYSNLKSVNEYLFQLFTIIVSKAKIDSDTFRKSDSAFELFKIIIDRQRLNVLKVFKVDVRLETSKIDTN